MAFISHHMTKLIIVVVTVLSAWPLLLYLFADSFTILRSEDTSDVESTKGLECVDRHAVSNDRVEDIFCLRLPKFESDLKNPCFYDYEEADVKRLRCIPYFYLVGMDKCGTTDLFNRITKHPDVNANTGYNDKETMFWAWTYVGIRHKAVVKKKLTTANFMDFFQGTADYIRETHNTKLIVGDASPVYLYFFYGWDRIPQNKDLSSPRILTPGLIKRFHQNHMPKFLLQLRNPIIRLLSDFEFLNYGRGSEAFHQAVVAAKAMMDECLQSRPRFSCESDYQLYSKLPIRIHTSCYSSFLKEWLKVFPLEAFHITRIEDYERDMAGTLNGVFRFLDVDPLSEEAMKHVLDLGVALKGRKNREDIYPETVVILEEYYKPCNQELAAMLGDNKFLWND